MIGSSVESALEAVRTIRALGVGANIMLIGTAAQDRGALTGQTEPLGSALPVQMLAVEPSSGPAGMRNRALLHAAHDHVVLMDADTELVSRNVDHFYRSIRETGAAAVYGTVICFGDHRDDIRVKNNESFRDRAFGDDYLDGFAMYDRQQILDSGGFSEQEALSEASDWELFLRLAANGRRIVFVPLVFGTRSTRPGSPAEEAAARKAAASAHIHARFGPLSERAQKAIKTRHLRYHPDIGYL